MKIKVKYLAKITPISKIKKGDWIDLRTSIPITIYKGQYCNIPLGVAIQLPKNYEALVVPRSSTFKKYKVIQANGIGVIDNSYCGDNDEWHFPCYAMEDTYIPKDTRICQFRIIKNMPKFSIKTLSESEKLNNDNRGGFGSTD